MNNLGIYIARVLAALQSEGATINRLAALEVGEFNRIAKVQIRVAAVDHYDFVYTASYFKEPPNGQP